MMKKAWLWLTALLIMLISSGAMAEIYVFDDLFASMEVPDSYIVLTDKNLPNYTAWLEARGSSLEDTQADFYNRGVLLQAWNEEIGAMLENCAPAVETDEFLVRRLRLRDLLLTQRYVLSAMLAAQDAPKGGIMITDQNGSRREAPRPLPERDLWFERVWKKSRG